MPLDGIQDHNNNNDNEIANDLSMAATAIVKHVQSTSAEKRAKLATIEGTPLHNASLLWLNTMLLRITETIHMIEVQLCCIASKSIVLPAALITSHQTAKQELGAESSAITLYIENNSEDDTPARCYAAMGKIQSAREKVESMAIKLTAVIPHGCVDELGDVQQM